MQRVQGWVENGNITVSIANTGFVSSTKVQGSFPLGTVTVYLAGTLTLASIYSDDLAVPTAKANPFTAASSGQWFFYAANAVYDVKFSGGGIAAPFTLGSIGAGVSDAGVPSYAFSALPTSKTQNQGNLARVSDRRGGLWMDSGSAWQAIDSLSGLLANVYDYGAIGNGIADDRAAFNSAITAMAALPNGGTVLVPEGSFKIGSNLTSTTAVQFVILKGGILKPSAGVTITLGGDLSAGVYQIFDPANGAIVLGRTSCRELIPQWWGALGDNSNDDQPAIQACFDAAFGPSGSAHGLTQTNAEVFIPAGKYRLGSRLIITNAYGAIIRGAGKQNTILINTTDNHHLYAAGFNRSRLEQITFQSGAARTGYQVSLDSVNSQVFGTVVDQCEFSAGLSPTQTLGGLILAESGGQADTCTISNCQFSMFYQSGYTQASQNALNNIVSNCDFQGCSKYGIAADGTVKVYVCGFENQFGPKSDGTSMGPDVNGAYSNGIPQIDTNGADIFFSLGAAGEIGIVDGCRSEGFRLVEIRDTAQYPVIRGNYLTPNVGEWHSLRAYTVGALVSGSPSAGDGQLYKCTVAGTTAAGEPTWPGSGGSVVDGTVTWTQVEYDVIGGTSNPGGAFGGLIEFNFLPLGRITSGGSTLSNFGAQCVIAYNTFSRTDWQGTGSYNGRFFATNATIGNIVAKGMRGGPFIAGAKQTYSGAGSSASAYTIWDIGTGLFLCSSADTGNNQLPDVGFGRGDQPTGLGPTGIYRLIGILSGLIPTVANTAGPDVVVAGTPGTGTGVGGKINLKTSPAGGAGSTPNALVTALQLDDATTANATRALIYDITAAALRRVTIGAADSGGVGFRVLRIPN